MSEAIFSWSPRHSPVWPSAYPKKPTAPFPTSASLHTATTTASAHDASLIAILDAPLATGEPAHIGFRRKEAELGEAFAALPVMDARALYKRLENPRTGDALAAKFSRLTADRRARLLAFLGDARRREALAQAGRK